jgi:hypothetical protein
MTTTPTEPAAPATEAPTRIPSWSIATNEGVTATGYLPAWSEDDPTTAGVPLAHLPTALADVSHRAHFDGQTFPVHDPDTGAPPTESAEERALWGVLVCNPYAEEPDPRVPVVNIAILRDYWINHLDQDGVAEVAAKLRAQADLLDHDVRPRLIAARAYWAAQQNA